MAISTQIMVNLYLFISPNELGPLQLFFYVKSQLLYYIEIVILNAHQTKLLAANKQRFIDNGEPEPAQLLQDRIDQLSGKAPPKKKRRSGNAAALGMTPRGRYFLWLVI